MIEVAPGTRIAVLADIHGNSYALDRVLGDIETRGGVDAFWLLGDYCAIGPDPLGVIERLEGLDNATLIRGNADRYIVDWPFTPPGPEEALAGPDRIADFIGVARSFAWTTGAIGATGRLDWLRALPLDFTARLPDGTRVLAVHASPGTDDGGGIHPGLTDAGLDRLVAGAGADLILFGHVHYPQDRRVAGVRVVDSGGVSNPLPPDLRAKYVILRVEAGGYQLDFHQVDYDREQVIAAAREANHPAWEYIASYMHGEQTRDWIK
jgi:predicted phosphodiesterase